MHPQARAYVSQFAGSYRSVVEIGSRNVNGGVRDLFQTSDYTGIDIYPGPGVDVVASGATYKPKRKVALVVCCEVLEHTAEAEQIVANALSMLAKGGLFVMTCATDPRAPHSAVDGGPLRPGEFYANVPIDSMTEWLKALDFHAEVQVHPNKHGDLYAHAYNRRPRRLAS